MWLILKPVILTNGKVKFNNDFLFTVCFKYCFKPNPFQFFQVQRVLKLLENPYSDDTDIELERGKGLQSQPLEASCSAEEHFSYDSKPPSWAVDLRVT